jgi:hypothetical protein
VSNPSLAKDMRAGDLNPMTAGETPPASEAEPVHLAVPGRQNPLFGIVSILILSGFIGASYALAWRAYTNVVARQSAQASEIAALRETVREHELSRQHVAERLESLQSNLQQNQQSTQLAIDRLLEQIASLRAELETPKNPSKQPSKIERTMPKAAAKPIVPSGQPSNPEGGARASGAEGRQ